MSPFLFSALNLDPTNVDPIRIEAARPVRQQGSTGEDRKPASHFGRVLGNHWGAKVGDFAEYAFDAPSRLTTARLRLRYARELAGSSRLSVSIDGQPVGEVRLPATGGWGDHEDQFGESMLALPALSAGRHSLRFVVPAFQAPVPLRMLPKVPVLDLVGGRTDKNTVGHGRNVALYTGLPSKFFYSTLDLNDVFSAVDGTTLDWAPDHVLVTPEGDPPANTNLDEIVIDEGRTPDLAAPSSPVFEQRQVCVTKDDVVISKIFLTNLVGEPVKYRVNVAGDCRGSQDYRGRPGGGKATDLDGGWVTMIDRNVFPSALPNGLSMVVGAGRKPDEVDASVPGAYRLAYDVDVPAQGTATLVVACAIGPDLRKAKEALRNALASKDPIADNRGEWERFYKKDVPSFSSSDKGLDELYAFRWFLLQFSRSGGDLGYLKYPVVLEGRQAYQTYCCYSAPFMAFDLNWATDPNYGYGQLANMKVAAYKDGRFPWYTTPQTNSVPLDHPSASGQSALPWAAWRFYQVHRRKDLVAPLYPMMKANLDWWIRDRDSDGNGLFSIEHQLETGMDDLDRRWKGPEPKRYEAIDATAYAILNLRAVANMARILDKPEDAAYYAAYADRSAKVLETILWDPALERYRDRSPDTGELTDYDSITIFYPLFAGVAEKEHLSVIRRYLLNPKEYATPWPVPAISQTDPEFDTVGRYWAGPTWPAANSHVAEGFIEAAKRQDRSLLPEAARLFHRMAELHLRPRADFYEHYNSLTGEPMSTFRDYMHSWWIDIIVRHVAGLDPQDDGSLVIDPLPLDLTHFELKGAPFAGHRVDVLYNGNALTVRIDGRVAKRIPDYRPGTTPVRVVVDKN